MKRRNGKLSESKTDSGSRKQICVTPTGHMGRSRPRPLLPAECPGGRLGATGVSATLAPPSGWDQLS